MSYVLHNIGMTYRTLNMPEEAVKSFSKSVEIDMALNSNPSEIALSLKMIGKTYLEINRREDAKTNLKKAAEYYKDVNEAEYKDLMELLDKI